MNRLLARVNSDTRACSGGPVTPVFYALFTNILERLEALEQLNELGRHQL
jgi:hypothetical protein